MWWSHFLNIHQLSKSLSNSFRSFYCYIASFTQILMPRINCPLMYGIKLLLDLTKLILIKIMAVVFIESLLWKILPHLQIDSARGLNPQAGSNTAKRTTVIVFIQNKKMQVQHDLRITNGSRNVIWVQHGFLFTHRNIDESVSARGLKPAILADRKSGVRHGSRITLIVFTWNKIAVLNPWAKSMCKNQCVNMEGEGCHPPPPPPPTKVMGIKKKKKKKNN